MRVAIIGAGLGGLLAANVLAKKGYKIDVFEKLPFAGGRFTNLNYKGFILTDDLNMGALEKWELQERIILGLASGHNLLIYCGKWQDFQVTIFDIKTGKFLGTCGEDTTAENMLAKSIGISCYHGFMKHSFTLYVNLGVTFGLTHPHLVKYP